MQDITISLSENVLKVSTIENKEFKGVAADVTKGVVEDYDIKSPEEFAAALKELISAITDKNLRKLSLNVLVEPNDVIYKFIPVKKQSGDIEDQIIDEVKDKVKEFPLEEMYFSYRKIAPFVYQFIGVKKEIIENYLEVANILGLNLRGIFPWIMLLPRFTNNNEPAIYLTKVAGKQVVALSEFNGIFFSGVYEDDKSTKELQKIVEDLSIYKRKDPINKVYVYNYENFSLNPEYQVLDIEIPNSDLEAAKGYEMHLLLDFMKEKDKDLLTTQTNIINLLPVPVVQEEKSKAIVYVGVATAVLLLGLVVGGAVYLNRSGDGPEVIESTAQENEVLSEDTGGEVSDQQEEQDQEQTQDLNREDLVLRIENGAGIPGVAGRTETFLSDQGYVVDSIGNADEVGRAQTLIRIKPEKSQYQTLLLEDMAEDFDAVVEEDLPEDAAYDALIIIGTDAQI